jgi:hypothetical protein
VDRDEEAEARAEVGKIIRQLERVNPSARSLAEGMEETLKMRRLGVGELLRASLATGRCGFSVVIAVRGPLSKDTTR